MDSKLIRRHWVLFFIVSLCLGLGSYAVADASLVESESTGSNFIQDVTGGRYAQTSEVTIMLEKKMPPPTSPMESDASVIEVIGETASNSGLRSGQKPQTYEELEDPFAPEEEVPELTDPIEGYNRFMFDFNEGFYDNVLEPVARGYRAVIAEDFRMAISNVFDNAFAPVKLFSSVLQGDFEKSGRVVVRTLINTTVGLGGLLDVAGQEYDIKNVNEDFDQALGYYGVPTGPYVVLPLLGPSTLRNITGRVVDSMMSPSLIFAPDLVAGTAISVGDNINDASFILDDKAQLEDSAIDEYESVRDFYHQYRFGLVNE